MPISSPFEVIVGCPLHVTHSYAFHILFITRLNGLCVPLVYLFGYFFKILIFIVALLLVLFLVFVAGMCLFVFVAPSALPKV